MESYADAITAISLPGVIEYYKTLHERMASSPNKAQKSKKRFSFFKKQKGKFQLSKINIASISKWFMVAGILVVVCIFI